MASPTRRCLVCRRTARKADLTRLAVSGRSVVVDGAARVPGRGAYLCRRQECLDGALHRGGGRVLNALRVRATEVTIEEDRLRKEWSTHGAPALVGVGGETA